MLKKEKFEYFFILNNFIFFFLLFNYFFFYYILLLFLFWVIWKKKKKKITPNDFSSISNFDIMKRIQNAKKKKRPCSMNRKRINKSQEKYYLKVL